MVEAPQSSDVGQLKRLIMYLTHNKLVPGLQVGGKGRLPCLLAPPSTAYCTPQCSTCIFLLPYLSDPQLLQVQAARHLLFCV